MPTSVITYKNKKIIYADHRGLTGEKLLSNLRDAKKLIMDHGKGALTLANFEDSSLSDDVVKFLKSDEMKEITDYIAKETIVGIQGIKKMIYKIYLKLTGSTCKIFNTEDEAKEYLIS